MPHSTNTSEPAGWIFQVNPANYSPRAPLSDYLREARNKQASWYVGQHQASIRPGHPIFVWRAAGTERLSRGIIAHGRIETLPARIPSFPWERKYERAGGPDSMEVRSVVTLQDVTPEPIVTREMFLSDGLLRSLRILSTPRGTNFPLTAQQVARLSELYRKYSGPLPAPTEPSPPLDNRPGFLVRISFNTKGWTSPSGTAKTIEGGPTFNRRFGFGYEDWLFRTDWLIGGWHYGFIQAFNVKTPKYRNRALNVQFFVIERDKRKRHVADIAGLEVLDPEHAKDALSIYRSNGWFDAMRAEIRQARGNVAGLDTSEWAPNALNVRFRPEDLRLAAADDYFQPNPWLNKRWRYKPYTYPDQERQKLLGRSGERHGSGTIPEKLPFFRSGSSGGYVDPVHQRMAQKLLAELKREFPNARIVAEENWVDLKVETDTAVQLFELKSDLNGRTVIRHALGQLLEYGYLRPPNRPIAKLVIVGRTRLDLAESAYISRLRAAFSLPLEYRCIEL